ncbi:secretion protein HlyD [Saccharophagus degradans 2-40]|uniref:Secretion protein HlyD n=1 Tax=Saccharophagus degradans (strain 2-40 / ATCC 43961 / DSM 17024) TaxID=203122 RepID=Q21FN8_SACD2|nr:secretion protein HlyD [Saccharophagus degradans 2-40]
MLKARACCVIGFLARKASFGGSNRLAILNKRFRNSHIKFFAYYGVAGALFAGTAQVWAEGLTLNCRIEPYVQVDVSSAVEGVVSEIIVEKNDEVVAGDIVARLESGLESATVDLRRVQAEVESDIAAQQLALDFAERALVRVKDLYGKKAASFAELDKAKTEHAIALQKLEQAKDRREQAQMEHKRARANLSRYTITSPISGVVVDRYKEVGEHVDNEPIMRLAQLDPLRVEAYAPASMYGKIKEGMQAELTPELERAGGKYKAEVILVDKVIDGPSNTFGIRLSFPNPDQALPSGLRCTIEFPTVRPN